MITKLIKIVDHMKFAIDNEFEKKKKRKNEKKEVLENGLRGKSVTYYE